MRVFPRAVKASLLGLIVFGAIPKAEAVCTETDRTDCDDRIVSYTGTLDFFASGGSFAVAEDPGDDRPSRAVERGQVEIPAFRIRDRATLVAAYLYFGGSLFIDNDGMDEIDQEVEIKVPGSDDFHFVRGEQTYQSGAIPGFPEVSLYSVRADITSIMKEVNGPLVGSYEVQNFASDVLYNDAKHTVANASFSIVLIFEEPRIRPRTIVIFDGMQEVLGSTVSLPLSGFTVSAVPSGSMTIYALEGDCNPGPDQCENGNNLSGAERIRISAAKVTNEVECLARRLADSETTVTLSDEINPANDVFNRTINTIEPPLRNVPGTDIDQFDITNALKPGDTCVTVETTSPYPTGGQTGELIGLSYVIVGIDVFAPELREDSRIEIRTENGQYFPQYYPGDPLRISYVVSNTGNLPGTGISLEANLPPEITSFEVIGQPDGSKLIADPSGGPFKTGRLLLSDLSVRHGDATALELLVTTTCPLAEETLMALSATISGSREGGSPFARNEQTTLIASERCGARFYLFGDGGCQTSPFGRSPTHFVVFTLLFGFAWFMRKRFQKLAASLLIGLLSFGAMSCGETQIPDHKDHPPADVNGVTCPGQPGMVVIPAIADQVVFCIDAFEASSEATELGNVDQSAAGESGDGSTIVNATSARFVKPLRGVSWYQARAACANSGKRLCSAKEWITACRGDKDQTYPYGETYERQECNGHDSGRKDVVETGAMFKVQTEPVSQQGRAYGCVTQHGAYDMSGNLWEWNATVYLDNSRRGLVGGSFRSNQTGLRCITEDNYAIPTEADDAYGFRCCVDYPF